jgi:hypothetical protein
MKIKLSFKVKVYFNHDIELEKTFNILYNLINIIHLSVIFPHSSSPPRHEISKPPRNFFRKEIIEILKFVTCGCFPVS